MLLVATVKWYWLIVAFVAGAACSIGLAGLIVYAAVMCIFGDENCM